MRITVLVENTSLSDEIIAEHGLSLYIETGDRKILFDMGQSDAFLKNAEKLDLDLSAVDFAVLSHGHYDHGGGIKAFLSVNKKAPVYLTETAFGDYYNASDKYIGLDKELEGNERLIFVDGVEELCANCTLYTCNEKERVYGTEPYGLSVLTDGELKPDGFLHEQYLLVEENGKRILISGCSHKGVLNIAEWFRPNVLVGGFHFMKLDPEGEGKADLKRYAEILMNYGTQYYTCHCTGEEQFAYIKKLMSEKVEYIRSGERINL
ncbi:MAG: MBL fold metallo-hydrolase [Clostridia bacterium]|nr:MBL fold metallo-hydrolase [Clostridia bacterium]